jgi:hypothetical protein
MAEGVMPAVLGAGAVPKPPKGADWAAAWLGAPKGLAGSEADANGLLAGLNGGRDPNAGAAAWPKAGADWPKAGVLAPPPNPVPLAPPKAGGAELPKPADAPPKPGGAPPNPGGGPLKPGGGPPNAVGAGPPNEVGADPKPCADWVCWPKAACWVSAGWASSFTSTHTTAGRTGRVAAAAGRTWERATQRIV